MVSDVVQHLKGLV